MKTHLESKIGECDSSEQKLLTYIRKEQALLLFKHTPFKVFGIFASLTAIVLFFWNDIPHQGIFYWGIGIITITLIRIGIIFQIKSLAANQKNMPIWNNLFFFTAIISGTLWGSTALLMTGSIESTLFIALILLGMVAGSLVPLASHTLAFYGFSISALSILTYSFAVTQFFDGTILAIMVLVFLIVNLGYAIEINKNLAETLRLRFENIELVKKLNSQKLMAEKANADKSRFLAAASHDLRQPNQALGLFLESLDYLESDPEKKSILNKAQQAFRAMSKLLDQLLDISKLDAQIIHIEPQAIKLHTLLYRLTMEHMGQAERKGLELRLRPTDAVVKTDPVLLSRILSNLISNAIRYTNQGGILIGVRHYGSSWRIMVCDTGCGIPKEEQENIFQEFTQLGNPERDREKGLGLGLAIVHRLANMIKTTIDIQSHVGRGSCFSIKLLAISEKELGALPTVHMDSPTSLTNPNIIVIDDDKIARESLSTLLMVWKCHVHSFSSTNECVQALKCSNWQPDALIVDYRLREKETGVDAIHSVFDCLKHDIPALIITGDTSPERIVEAKKSGFPLLHKPVNPKKIKNFLSTLND